MSLRSALQSLRAEVDELLAAHERGSDLEEFAAYADDPVGFCRDVLHAEPWSRQVELLESIRDHPQSLVQGGNGVGKDWTLEAAALWWVYARRGLVLSTAATERQVVDVFMQGVGKLFRAAPDLPGELYRGSLRLGDVEEAGIYAFTSSSAGKLTGFHAARILAVLSEAQEVEPWAWEGMMSCAVGGEDRIVASGNPVEPSGKFYQSARSEAWNTIKIPVAEHPNLREDSGRRIPGGPDKGFVERMAREWGGEGSPIYIARVLGEFPEQGAESLFLRSWLDRAADLWERGDFALDADRCKPTLAVDVARFGTDSTVSALRQGPIVREIRTWNLRGTMETVEGVLSFARDAGLRKRYGYDFPSVGEIVVDTIGVGAGVFDRLGELSWPVVEFKGSAAARDNRRFTNARAESYWRLRDALEAGEVALPRDEELFRELLAVSWRPAGDGRIQLESKDDVKSKLGRSPDKADAVVMAFHGRTAARPPTVTVVNY